MPEPFIPENTQRALDEISSYSNLLNSNHFYLAGGTALAFKLKYRVSYDLDFFTSEEFNPTELLNKFENNNISNVKVDKGTLKFNLFNTEISFFFYSYKVLNDLEDLNGIKTADILDIALMKITAIADRGLEKDFADLYFAAKELEGLRLILNKFKDKFPNTNFEHYLKALIYFYDAEIGPRPNILIKEYNWEEIKIYFETEVREFLKKFAISK